MKIDLSAFCSESFQRFFHRTNHRVDSLQDIITVSRFPERRGVENIRFRVAAKIRRGQAVYAILQKFRTQNSAKEINSGTHCTDRLFPGEKVSDDIAYRPGAAAIRKQPDTAGDQQRVILTRRNFAEFADSSPAAKDSWVLPDVLSYGQQTEPQYPPRQACIRSDICLARRTSARLPQCRNRRPARILPVKPGTSFVLHSLKILRSFGICAFQIC